MSDNKVIFIDCEFADSTQEVIEISIYNLAGIEIYHSYFLPAKAKKWSLEPHNLSPEFLADKPLITKCLKDLQQIFDTAEYIVGYAVSNDVRNLEKEGLSIDYEKRIVDVNDIYWMARGKAEGYGVYDQPGLGHCVENMGIEFDHGVQHSASGDTYVTWKLYVALAQKLQEASFCPHPLSIAEVCAITEEGMAKEKEETAHGYVAVYQNGSCYSFKGGKNIPSKDNPIIVLELNDWKKGLCQLEYEGLIRRNAPKGISGYKLSERDLKRIRNYSNSFDLLSYEVYRKLYKNWKR